jgi:hypothetical protein
LILESNFVQPDDRTHVVELVTKSA